MGGGGVAPWMPPTPLLHPSSGLQMVPSIVPSSRKKQGTESVRKTHTLLLSSLVVGGWEEGSRPWPWRPQVTRTTGARLQLEQDLCPRVLLHVGSRPCCPSHTQQGSADQPGHTPALPQSRGPSEFRGSAEAERGSGSWTQAALCSVRVTRVCQALPLVLKMTLPGDHHLSRCVCVGMEPHGCPLTKVTG